MANRSGRGVQLELDGAASRQGHASRSCYQHGCREPACIEANTRYQRDYRAGTRGTRRDRHGPYRLDDAPRPGS